MSEYPLVTNAIPLYRSKRFVEIIISNIEAIDYPNIEILISDHHQYDDAIGILEERLRNDPRVTIIKTKNELNYAQHYNMLLSLGRGKYFRWMPHDDSYPKCCLKEMVEILESHPEVVLVNGPWHALDDNGKVIEKNQPGKSRLGYWSFETSLLVAFGGYEGHAFKGLFRRDVAVGKGIWLFDTERIISPERCWEFAMSLVGEFYNYESFEYHKRYYPGSTKHTWQQAEKPVDTLFTWYYKLRYQWALDRKPLRILAFVTLMVPLTLRQIYYSKLSPSVRSRIMQFHGLRLKGMMSKLLSKL
jgi:glycosyltransferase involved in cell wall biosynthesis